MAQARYKLEILGLGTCNVQVVRNKISDINLCPGLSFVRKPQERSIPTLIFEREK